MKDVFFDLLSSPVGPLLLTRTGQGLSGLTILEDSSRAPLQAHWVRAAAAFADVAEQLEAYFRGERFCFELVLDLEGTAFQKQVWQQVSGIGYGTTTSYGALAARLGRPKAARAVGAANGRNPVWIVVPCHRVIATDGSLTGYGGGLSAKRFLLSLEARHRLRT